MNEYEGDIFFSSIVKNEMKNIPLQYYFLSFLILLITLFSHQKILYKEYKPK